jgi:hypothetical protein
MFHREAVTWKHLNHPNIVPFLRRHPRSLSNSFRLGCRAGVWLSTSTSTRRKVDSRSYVSSYCVGFRPHPLVSYYDIAEGLNLPPLPRCGSRGPQRGRWIPRMSPQPANRWQPNILIDGTGHACIAGLDLMATTSDLEPTSSTERPAVQLAAPEVLGGGTAHQQRSRHVFICDGHDRGTSPERYHRQSRHSSLQGFHGSCSIPSILRLPQWGCAFWQGNDRSDQRTRA